MGPRVGTRGLGDDPAGLYAGSSLREGLNVRRITGGLIGAIIAFIAGIGLAVATVVGVVQTQRSAGEEPITTTNVSYGSNN